MDIDTDLQGKEALGDEYAPENDIDGFVSVLSFFSANTVLKCLQCKMESERRNASPLMLKVAEA